MLALGAVALAETTHQPRWDGVGTLAIGILLAAIAMVLAIKMKGLLIGKGASNENVRSIEEAIAASPDVVRLIHLRTQHLGPEELLVGAKIHFRDELDVAELARAINETEQRIRAVIPYARPMYIEPDLYRPEPA